MCFPFGAGRLAFSACSTEEKDDRKELTRRRTDGNVNRIDRSKLFNNEETKRKQERNGNGIDQFSFGLF